MKYKEQLLLNITLNNHYYELIQLKSNLMLKTHSSFFSFNSLYNNFLSLFINTSNNFYYSTINKQFNMNIQNMNVLNYNNISFFNRHELLL